MPNRAARFIERFLPDRGAKVGSDELDAIPGQPITEDDLLDLLATLAFERGTSAKTSRTVKWCVSFSRTELGLEPEKIPVDTVAGCRCERFTIERLA